MSPRYAILALLVGCADDAVAPTDTDAPAAQIVEGTCTITADTPPYLPDLPCTADFFALASTPLDATLPGARSVKVVLDRADGDRLYFQDSARYAIHYAFVSEHLSGGELPLVPPLSEFNTTEYFSPERRFVLGAVTRYDGPGTWALELSPYDTASAEMITALFTAVQAHAFFGPALRFHPTSENVQVEADRLGPEVPLVSTDELYAGTAFQPLSLGAAIGRLRFMTSAELADAWVPFEDILVLDQAPNDISVVQGLITEAFQTPLSHVNVLSLNRRTPNMGLRGAMSDPTLRALEGRLVELTVAADTWSVREASEAEALAAWEARRPAPVVLPTPDLSITELRDIADVAPETGGPLRDDLREAARAWGGKAAHYAVLARTAGVPIRPAFAIPIYHYDRFMRDNGFYDRIDALLTDPTFTTDAAVRDAELAALRADMEVAPVDQGLQDALRARAEAPPFAGHNLRFRTSTNSEDLDGFPCAGCYESHTGEVANWEDVLDAIRETWASAWLFRTFEERSYYRVDHHTVGMALLVHANFPDEEANGVAVTNNPYDPSGLDPAFYINVQQGGDAEVVAPPPGVTSDQLLYWYYTPNQPTAYLSRSNLVSAGGTVLDRAQLHELGAALAALHERFSPAYGPAAGHTGWYAMDVELKYDDEDAPGEAPRLYIKQARPYPQR